MTTLNIPHSPRAPVRAMYQGDNLSVLRGINSETIDLIATDPPFNKGRDFHATPDSLASGASFTDRWRWDEDVHDDWIDAIEIPHPRMWSVIQTARDVSGDDMGAFLCFIGVRLIEMHRVLKPTGSIYLHCDHTASHYLRALMDAVFGRRQFRNDIIWFYNDSPGRPKSYFPRKHDIIFWYSKSDDWTFNGDAVRVPIKDASKKRYKTPRVIGGRSYTGGESASNGKIPEDVWKIPVVKKNRGNKQSTGYATQKPLKLYERIIKSSSNPGDIVLDPFAGCATTPIAAEIHGRGWIGIDLWDGAFGMIKKRMAKEGLADDETRDTLVVIGDVHFSKTPPTRTDLPDPNEVSVPDLELRTQFLPEPWEQIKPARIRELLELAQAAPNTAPNTAVVCGGCGRICEPEFMHLDHISPKADGGSNDITNRILLCAPCNGFKGSEKTLSGLVKANGRKRANGKPKWMRDAKAAAAARKRATKRGERAKRGDY